MLQKLHKNAKTNYAIRREIQSSSQSIAFLARKFNLSWLTVKKWKERTFIEDESSRPDKLRISLTKHQEDLILFERKKFKKSIEEIYLTLETIISNLYPVKIYRCLTRYGLSILPEELVKAERQIKIFRKYTIPIMVWSFAIKHSIEKPRKFILLLQSARQIQSNIAPSNFVIRGLTIWWNGLTERSRRMSSDAISLQMRLI